MKKLQISVTPDEWGDLNTKYPSESPFVGVNEFTAGSFNIDTSRKGVLTKRPGSVTYSTLPNAPKDQYEAIFSDGTRHLLTVDSGILRYTPGDGVHTTVLSGLTPTINCEFATTQNKVYFGNGVQKKVYDRVTSYGGVTYTFPTQTTKDMGCQAPAIAPTAALAAGGSIPAGAHTYKVTFLYYGFEESNGSGASNSVTTGAGNSTVNFTLIPIGGYGVTARKIYRDNADDNYYLVGVVNNNTATAFSDTVNAVTTPMPTDNNTPPDFTLITLYLDKLFLAGVSGDPYSLYFSETALPDIFLGENTLTCNEEDPITGIVVYLDRLVVFNRKSMGQILGRTSDQFRYSSLEGSVGCIDNRSIQVRVIDGVPVLLWLSDKGFYAFDGNSINYISDKIEDQVNLEIQQASIQKGKNAQSDYVSFTQGVSSDGINLEVAPGSITTKGPFWDTFQYPLATYEDQTNPKLLLDTQVEWENGDNLVNIVTKDIVNDLNTLKAPVAKTFVTTEGTNNGTIFSGSDITLTQASNFIGLSDGGPDPTPLDDDGRVMTRAGELVYFPRAGTLTAFSFWIHNTNVASQTVTPTVYTNSGGTPGLILFTGSPVTVGGSSTQLVTTTLSLSISAGTPVFLGWSTSSTSFQPSTSSTLAIYSYLFNHNGFIYTPFKVYNGTIGWHNNANGGVQILRNYTFNQSPVSASGQWTSTTYDSFLYSNANSLNMYVEHTATFPAGTAVDTVVQQSDNSDMSSSTDITQPSFTGVSFFPFTATKRYWRIKLNLSTTDDRTVPTAQGTKLRFPVGSFWYSKPIDCTSDVTSYVSAILNSSIPPNTNVILAASSSPNNITYTSYTSIGSLLVQRYIKFRITFSNGGVGTDTSKVYSLTFKWQLQANLKSFTIDTGSTPSGWDVFQSDYVTNGSTVEFYMRSGPDLVLEGAVNVPGTSPSTVATWYQVFSGQFPTVSLPTKRYVQWKAVITSDTDKVPVINSVTVSWFIGTNTNSIRCASIFFNKNYYLSASEFGNSTNNLLFMFDFKGKWRVLKGLNIGTFSFFFNNPYYGDTVTKKVCKFWEQSSDSGNTIEFDFRSRAFDFSSEYVDNQEMIKILDNVILMGKNTGASYSCSYSLDEGATFNLLQATDGSTTWTTTTDSKKFIKFLRPNYETSIGTGRTIMIRVYNNDTNEVELDGFKMTAFVRTQPPIITG